MPDALNETEQEYVYNALRSGQMPIQEITLILVVSRLLQKELKDVQSNWMDCRVGVQQVYRKMAEGVGT